MKTAAVNRRSDTRRLPPATTFASAVASMARPLQFFTDNLCRYPEIFRSGLLSFSAYVIHHPEYVRHVLSDNARNYIKFEKYRYLRLVGGNGLVTNEGESWVRQRRLIQPAFSRAAIERACQIMYEETSALIQKLARSSQTVINVGEVMGQLTIAIVARTLFSSDVHQYVPTIRRELDVAQRRGNVLLRTPLPVYSLVPYLPFFNRITKAAECLRGIIMELINRRRASGNSPGDLLDTLMSARDGESAPGMTDEQLRDEVLTLLLAGHETTLLALTWAFYLVARHPPVYDRLRSEAVAVSDAIGATGLERLAWSRAAAREAMRLYPPAYVIGRNALQDDELGEYAVPAGTNVLINIYGLHRHPRYWQMPHEFRPERMLDRECWEPAYFVYLPFGAGARSCIGSQFALYEMQTVLSCFARAFTFTPEFDDEIAPAPRITLIPSEPVRLRLKRQIN